MKHDNSHPDEFSIGRRDWLRLASAGSLLAAAKGAGAGEDMAQKMMPGMHMPLPPGPRLKVAMLVYPRMILLDLTGPLTVMNLLRADVDLYWKDRSPLLTDVGIAVAATRTFEECPQDLDVLFVPGGIMGTIDCMNDAQVTGFLADRGKTAKWVTSVCTGSLALGAAGLLEGYDATSHWGVADLLPLLGARHVDQRVVRDGNRITGGGVTAGIDFGIELAALLKGEEEARRVQLTLEYSPQPPYRNGTPEEAGPQRMEDARKRRSWMDDRARVAAVAARARLGLG